ncbi:hypothetical protein HU200_056739 [Digitaria exilis]|uniref:RING-type E3 ubiquitin transferase n=1 Tax=Digitaria exilis TaxID=1010633 RepID=A0A835AII2_9POAL|nr:hypothetical protein HU200_056739 [Digitaria exilis]CAB3477038.1 unnamed protein product [Digitaria exilis]
MSGQSSSPYGETNTGVDTAPAAVSSSIRWAPHGRAMTACLVAVNVALVALVYLYFWRVLSRKRAATPSSAAAGDDDSSSSAASSPARAQDDEQRRQHDRLVASLPTAFVARGAGEECAVCIAELRDGEEARALPRCGHRFHAACVEAWLRRRHTTCPLCRASVVVAVADAEAAGPKGGGVTGTTTAAAAVEEDMDAPPV